MCKCKYNGFACGHSHPAGASLSIERCDSLDLCSPISYVLDSNGRRHCPNCQRVLGKLYVVWKAQREEWTRTAAVPEAEITRVSGEIIGSFADLCQRLIPLKGPYHRAQDQYGAIQETLLAETKKFAEDLGREDRNWNENMKTLCNLGDGDEIKLHVGIAQRERARAQLKRPGFYPFVNAQMATLVKIGSKVYGYDIPTEGGSPFI